MNPREMLIHAIKQAQTHLLDPEADVRTVAKQLQQTAALVLAEMRQSLSPRRRTMQQAQLMRNK